MKELWLKYKDKGLNSKWVEVDYNVDVIRIEANNTIFEITPIKNQSGAFNITSMNAKPNSINFVARNDSVEVHFTGPEGVEVY